MSENDFEFDTTAVPLPAPKRSKGKPFAIPLDVLEVGQSMEVFRSFKSARGIVYRFERQDVLLCRKFKVRATPRGARIWRVE
jgi:hypothetical protein